MQTPTPPRFSEKHGGLIVSLTFHVAVFMLLQNVALPVARVISKPELDPIRIELQPVETNPEEPAEIEEAEEMTAQPPEPEISENVATVKDTSFEEMPEGEEVNRPSRQIAALPTELIADRDLVSPRAMEERPAELGALIQTDLVAPAERLDSTQDVTEFELDERIQEYLRDRERALNEYNDAIGRQGSDRVAQRMSLARAELEGKRWLETTEGAQEGAIRSFATSDVDQKIAEEVFARYGIQSYAQYFDGTSKPDFGYLNTARTKEATYVRREGQGVFQVMSIPESAVARLVQLERDALIRQGHNPARTRVIEVEFGIASVGRSYDLVVKNLKVAPIEFRP